MKKVLGICFLLALVSVDMLAADGLTGLNKGGGTSSSSVIEFLNAWKWIFALVPFGVGAYLFGKTNEYITNQEKQNGQTEPSWLKRGKCVGGFFGGVFLVFITYGVAGYMFGDENVTFMTTWNSLVTSFWSQFFTV